MESSLDQESHDSSCKEESQRIFEHEAKLIIFTCFMLLKINEQVNYVREDELVEDYDPYKVAVYDKSASCINWDGYLMD